jgi:hypothetical protein
MFNIIVYELLTDNFDLWLKLWIYKIISYAN